MSRAPHARSRTRLLAYAAAAVALATGWMHGGSADARRVNPRDEVAELRAELARTRDDLASYQSAYTELSNGLDKVERLNARGGRNVTTKIQSSIDRARRSADQHLANLGYGGGYDSDHDAGYDGGSNVGGGYYYTMSDGDFKVLLNQLRNAYASEQPTIAADAAVNAYFTVDQVVRMLAVVSYDSARVEVAAAVYSHVIDADGWFRVYDSIEYTSNRQALRERVGSAAN